MEASSETARCLCQNGCGCSQITISVTPTTGGQFQLAVMKSDTIENLKKLISKKLKVPKERICLLYRERQLRDGTVEGNQLVDGSRLTLLPSVETGLLAQRPEQSVMQALESLNDSQVNDFLSGKAPLNLTMRLGDHMMLIQLQLSTVAPGRKRSDCRCENQRKSTDCRCELSSSTSSVASGSSTPLVSPQTSVTTVSSSSSPSSSSATVSQSPSSSSGTSPLTTPHHHPPHHHHHNHNQQSLATPPPTTTPTPPSAPPPSAAPSAAAPAPAAAATATAATLLDTRALAEASRNLTQTLKQLSSEVLTSKSDDSSNEGGRRQGAIIESMHHHGKGVYSGTFSGTLNPALQDKFGRPKRDISTIIHILNDLLCATPQYRATLPTHIPATNHQATTPGESSLVGGVESVENRATRGKMERLRLVLGQRRERRRAMRSRPYSTSPSAASPQPPHTQHDSVTA